MPGVLIVEGMAQLAGLLLEEGVRRERGDNVKALLSIIEKSKFRRPVKPGDTLEYHAEVRSVNEAGGKIAARATVDGAPGGGVGDMAARTGRRRCRLKPRSGRTSSSPASAW